MTLTALVHAHFHELTASTTAATYSALSPAQDLIYKVLEGILVGVGVWCVTKALSWAIGKLSQK